MTNELKITLIIMAFAMIVIGGAIVLTADGVDPISTYAEEESVVDSFRIEYINGCVESAGHTKGARAYCACTYRVLVKNMGEENLIKDAVDYVLDNKLSPRMKAGLSEAIVECIDLY